MSLANTPNSYGALSKGFHWLSALLILTTIPLGIVANDLAQQIRDPAIATTDADAARAALFFSIHKTLGVSIFCVALARILWALTQPRPGLLNGDRTAEARIAETVHWLLYGSLVAVPLSGWVSHAATTGFAPIWWPFGQSLPFVPKDETVAQTAASLHYLLQWVLVGALALHIAGALKHHFIDADATLRRMLPGHNRAIPSRAQPGHALPVLGALAVWAGVLGGAGALGWLAPEGAARRTTALAAVEGDWRVEDGTLTITILQLGAQVTGDFADWTAEIAYSETPGPHGKHGGVSVIVAIPSLSLGSVTDQAMGPGFFDAQTHPTASFEADILATEGGHLARGTLTIKGKTVPVEMPFTLSLQGDRAQAQGRLGIDRRDFGIGLDTMNEATLGFGVEISFQLAATRS